MAQAQHSGQARVALGISSARLSTGPESHPVLAGPWLLLRGCPGPRSSVSGPATEYDNMNVFHGEPGDMGGAVWEWAEDQLWLGLCAVLA